MKQSNAGINHTYQSSFTHSDCVQNEYWSYCDMNFVYEKLEDSVIYLSDEE